MILEDCQKLVDLAERYSNLKTNANQLSSFTTRQANIEKLVNDLTPLMLALRIFQSRGIQDFTAQSEAEIFLKQVTEVQIQFASDPQWLIDPKKIKPLQDRCEALRKVLEMQLVQKWTAYRDEKTPKISNQLLNVFDKIPTFKNNVIVIRDLLSKINSTPYPKDLTRFEKVDELIEQLTTAWNSLNSTEVPEEVLDFLKQVVTINGAPMNLLTPSVQQWLDDRGIDSSFRIRLFNNV